jgi:hypothetical protein
MSVLNKLIKKIATKDAIRNISIDLIMIMSGLMIGAFVKALFNTVSIL